MAPSGHLMTMPALIVNMGGEMVYILEQRLQAQKIPEAKGQKVLNDVVRTMYYTRFIEELFKPQEMYSIQSTRQIFDRLAHSSIMRLNESSMDKLFDLMAMGVKYQIISCASPEQVMDITLNHLEVLRRLVGGTASVLGLVDECIRHVQMSYGGMPLYGFNHLRQSMCRFFQDRKVKVSLFLHDHTQNGDGSIVVPSGGTLPAAGQLVPGTVRYFDCGQEARREQLPCVGAGAWLPGTGAKTRLGSNVYEKEREPSAGVGAAAPGALAQADGLPPASPQASYGLPPLAHVTEVAKTAAAVGELNMLASLIGPSQPATATDNFRLESLFGADMFGGPGADQGSEVIHIDGGAVSAGHRGSLDAVRQQMDIGGPLGGGLDGSPAGDGEPDLLDLMDNA